VRVEEGRVAEIEPRSLDVVRWAICPVDVTDVRSLDQILPLVEHALAEASDGAEGRLLATRLRLTGHSPIHSRLHAEHERLVNECRALVFSAGIPDVWIEKLVVETHPSAPVSELSREDAFGGLLRTIHALELDGDRLSALSEEVELLALKLPPVLRGGDDPFDPSDPEYLAGCLEDVKALLVERLRGQGDPQEGAG
jgi:hypothetical protein